MKQSAHRFIAQYFMDHSHLVLGDRFISAEDGCFKCNFTVDDGNDVVKIVMQYITAENDEDSWVAAGGVIGPMGKISNLYRMLDYLSENMVPSYALAMEKPNMTLILNRSFRIRNLDLHSMYDLTDGLANEIRALRGLGYASSVTKEVFSAGCQHW